VSDIEPDDVTALFELRTALDEQAARIAARVCAAASTAGERGMRSTVGSAAAAGATTRGAAPGGTAPAGTAATSAADAGGRFAALASRFAAVDAATLRDDDLQRHGYYALVAEFDAALDESLSSSPYLGAAIQSTRVHLARVRRLARADDQRLAQSAAEHAAIARAIADGDPERAAAATRLHLHEALTSIHAHLPRRGDDRTQEKT
jgi:DNA-binding GntR family transcriptional regulator